MKQHKQIKLITFSNEDTFFIDMYTDYCKELNKFEDSCQTNENADEFVSWLVVNPNIKIDFAQINNQTIGFIIYSFFPYSLSQHCVYIQDLYILPKFRCCKYASEIIKQMDSKYNLDFCLHIIKDNIIAIKFWENIMTKLGFLDSFEIGQIKAHSVDNNLLFKCFAKKTKENNNVKET